MIKFQVRFHFYVEDRANSESIYSFFVKAHTERSAMKKAHYLLSDLVPDERVIDEINVRRIKRVAGLYNTIRSGRRRHTWTIK